MAIQDFPDATNTGVPSGVTLTPYYGNLVIDTPGAVIEGLDIQGNVIITADNVTLKNCKVTSSAFSVVSISSGVTGVVVQDCEINGLGETGNSRGIGGQGTFLRNNIYNVENGINIEGSNTLIQGNYIHDLNASLAYGYDGIQILGGVSNITVSDNTIINSQSGTAVRIVNDYGAVDGVIVDNNMLSGGDFAVLSEEKSSNSGQITGVQFTNNYLDKVNDYAFVANNIVVWQGNIDFDTSWPVAQNGTLTENATPSEITVLGNGVNITDGDTSPSSTDLTNFGSVSQNGTPVQRTFTVRNDGGSTLTTSGLTLPSGFSLVEGLSSSIAPGSSDAFTVRLDTTSTGTKSGQISFNNNDGNESPFNFSITGTVNAVAQGVPTDFPDATNTGVPSGVTLTPYYGNLVIDTPGAVIEGLDIQGNVIITADNVTLKNCKVTSSAVSVVSISSGVTGVVVQDCEINGLGETGNSRGIGGQGTFLRNNIYNVENGINIEGSNTLIQGNYIHDLNASLAYGYDGIQILGGVSNITVSDNTIINSQSGTAVRIVNDYGAVDGVIVDNNMLSGGDFAVLSEEKSSNSGQITGVQFTNNYLDKVNDYAFVANNIVVWQGNIDFDTSWPVAQNGTLTENATPSEITVLGNGVNITDGDTSPSSTDLTNFGSVSQNGTPVQRTFTVRNDGGSTLTTSGVTLPSGFSLVEGLSSSIAPGSSDTFTVQLDTTSTGTKSGQISFNNNDGNESPFNFSITGTVASTPSEITVLGNGVNITDGDTSPSSTDLTNFGSVSQNGTPVQRTFTVRNDGGSTLTTSGLTLPSGFSLVEGLSSSIAPGSSDAFTVRLDTTSTGTKSGQISFNNNDGNESPFNFSITGTVASTPSEITVLGNGVNITDGDTSPSSTDLTNFGSVSQNGTPVQRTFTVRNDGGSTLTTSGLTLPSGFSLVEGLSSSIAPGSSDAFTVRLDTTSTGTKSGQISFNNNDGNESPFNFSITGTVNGGGGNGTALSATPANFASQVAAATNGQTILLASGNYGTWSGTNKNITIAPQVGATVTMGINFGTGDSGFTINGTNGTGKISLSGGKITGSANNITIKNSAFTSSLVIDGPINSNILLDNDTFININTTTGGIPAAIHLSYYSATQVFLV